MYGEAEPEEPADDTEDAGTLADSWHIETLADAVRPGGADKVSCRWATTYAITRHRLRWPRLIEVDAPGRLGDAVAAGKRWLEPLPEGRENPLPFVNQAKVLWIDFDNGRRCTRERIGAIGRGHDLPEDTAFRYVSMPTRGWMRQTTPSLSSYPNSFEPTSLN